MKSYVLDTSAIVAFRDDEEGSDFIQDILKKSHRGHVTLYVSFMTFMELYYCVFRSEGKGAALRAYMELQLLPVTKIESDEELLLIAGEIKATHQLSLGDSWIAAAAFLKKACLVHKDPEFESITSIEQKILPYKRSFH